MLPPNGDIDRHFDSSLDAFVRIKASDVRKQDNPQIPFHQIDVGSSIAISRARAQQRSMQMSINLIISTTRLLPSAPREPRPKRTFLFPRQRVQSSLLVFHNVYIEYHFGSDFSVTRTRLLGPASINQYSRQPQNLYILMGARASNTFVTTLLCKNSPSTNIQKIEHSEKYVNVLIIDLHSQSCGKNK
jgi:hypothetical protein